MNLKEMYENRKKKLEEIKKQKDEMMEKANYNVYDWYQFYGSNPEAAGVGFIMPDNFEISTSTSSYRHDAAAQLLFPKYYNKNLEQEEIEKGMPWFMILPKYYNTICIELVSPYSSAGPDMLIFLPDEINDFQKEMLFKLQNEIDYYSENIKLKVKYRAGLTSKPESENEFDRIDEIIDTFYNKEIERSEQNAKI